MTQPAQPLTEFLEAIDRYNPIHVLLMFSGGHDSLVSTHYIASILDIKKIEYSVYHGDTGIGIAETKQYVKNVCHSFGWDLVIRSPIGDETYEAMVKKAGFPGSTKQQHQIQFRNLKEKPLRRYITHELKTMPYARENVILVTGARSSESKIRMGYKQSVRKVSSQIWTNPIMDWTDKMCENWMKQHNLPRNKVKDSICISGECLCGCYAKKEEFAEIKACYPEAAAKILSLQKYSPWKWGSGGKAEWIKHNPPGQLKLFELQIQNDFESWPDDFFPMCVGCEEKQQETL